MHCKHLHVVAQLNVYVKSAKKTNITKEKTKTVGRGGMTIIAMLTLEAMVAVEEDQNWSIVQRERKTNRTITTAKQKSQLCLTGWLGKRKDGYTQKGEINRSQNGEAGRGLIN